MSSPEHTRAPAHTRTHTQPCAASTYPLPSKIPWLLEVLNNQLGSFQISLWNGLPELPAQTQQSEPRMTRIFLAGHHLLCLTNRDLIELLSGTAGTDPQKLHPPPQGNRVLTKFSLSFISSLLT